MKKFHIINGPMAGRSFDLKDDIVSIGRDPDNFVQIKDSSISRKHAKILKKNDKYFIEDLYSQNGVWVNDHPIKPGHLFEITEGLPMAIGKVFFTLGKNDFNDGMITQYSINLLGEAGSKSKSQIYKNRRVTDRKKLELIYEISMLLMQSLDVEEICEKIMDSLFECLGRMENGTILVINDETGELQEIISRARDGGSQSTVNYSRSIVHRVIEEGKAVMMSDTSREDESDLSDSIEMMRVKSLMCVPLISKSKILGVIYVHSVKAPYGFRKDDLFFFTAISSSAALAIENALLFSTHKRIAKALKESEKKYRLLVENANDAIFIVQNGMILFANPSTLNLIGFSKEELFNTPFITLFHHDDREGVLERLEKSLKGNQGSNNYSCRLLNKDGEDLWVQISAVTINWEGKPATLFFTRDLTRQRILEDQLLQAHKMEAIHTLAGGISNDLNNLLMGIQGNTSLMLFDMSDKSPHYKKLKQIERYVRNGAMLAEKLFSFTASGKYLLQSVNMNQIVTKTLAQYSHDRKGVQIHENYNDHIFSVEVDQRQIEQALFNIYANAWQAMPDGGELYINTDNVTFDEDYAKPFGMEGGRYVKISITDTGSGMDKKTQVRIFDPFFTTKKMGKGMGLGLAAVYWIIKNHNGIVNVYSEKDKGTTFNIFLPAKFGNEELRRFISDDDHCLRGTEAILLADDSDITIDVGTKMLKKLGYDVLVARNGKEVLDFIVQPTTDSSKIIKLIILDMIMPDMDGGEVFDSLKKMNPHIKVLLSSGHSLNGQATTLLDRGGDGFIQKPFNIEELSKKLREILDRKESLGLASR